MGKSVMGTLGESVKTQPLSSPVTGKGKKENASVSAARPEEKPSSGNEPLFPQPQREASPAKTFVLKGPLPVKEFAAQLGLKPFQLIHHLMELNIFATLTQVLDEEAIRKVCAKLGYTIVTEKRERHPSPIPKETKPTIQPPAAPSQDVRPRPPVVTFMGHVDHGKTSLLDAIRSSRVAQGEVGGITQHIGAYTVQRQGRTITFIDTPGHEAFTAMRARGAQVTDIVVLVVAADDGVMPQTVEAIHHAKAAKVPILVAINKIDLPTANPLRVKTQLQEYGLVPEEFGGDTIVCEVSALKKKGIEDLLDLILLQAEVMELRANVKGPAKARVIESQMETGRGPTATVIVQSGCLRVGDVALCGHHWGRVRALIDDMGRQVKEVYPGYPVRIVGLDGLPQPGEELLTDKDERKIREMAEARLEELKRTKAESPPKITLENLFAAIAEDQKKTLSLVLKADTQGSLEALSEQLRKLPQDKVQLEIVHAGVGPVSESDILLAKASQGIVIGFHTRTDGAAVAAAKREGVQIKLFGIIYELVDQVREAMQGLLEPELRETILGVAVVKKVFALSKYTVAGCFVESGRLVHNARARVLRKRQPVYDGTILTLKRFQDEVAEVRAGMECGLRLSDFNQFEEGDRIECYQLEKVPQSL
uniref:translation initiation factor IF-2 n=1 Tax=Candidatus Methylacidithermus pantelleriae TaxID=2744239 RepID=UPI001F0156A6|nr:translation initiation factor IF-2 [Candidatus Methylacidithermus pantelleriae]